MDWHVEGALLRTKCITDGGNGKCVQDLTPRASEALLQGSEERLFPKPQARP